MAVTLSTFLVRYPEFEEIKCKHRALVEAILDEAEAETDPTIASVDSAIMALAAQKLARSACGRDAGLVDKKTGMTAYDWEVEQLINRTLAIRIA